MTFSLQLLLALTLPLFAAKVPAKAGGVPFVYVGGYRPEISIFRLDPKSGALTPAGSADGGKEPSFLAFHPSGKYLYAVNEVPEGRVVAFAVDQKTGALTRLNEASSAGVGPAHLSVDPSGHWLLVANYADPKPGTVASLPIRDDGSLGAPVSTRDFGPATMPHSIRTDPTDHFVFVPCKGGPYVAQLLLDLKTGALTPNTPDRVASAPKTGPRHMDFHPNGKFAYVINEQAMTMTTYALDARAGKLTEIETVSTLPAGVTGGKDFSTADVHVHPSGKWLYGSNRGHNSIVIYKVDAKTGKLALVGHETRTIDRPRNFHVDPTGKLLMVANQNAASVTTFRIDEATGKLEQLGAPTPAGAKPSFVGVLMLPGK
jgi:6-phosphogluconolactonase